MQNTVEEHQAKVGQVQRKGLYDVRAMASLLGIQGVASLILNMRDSVSLYSHNPPLVLSLAFLSLTASLLWLLLSWGLWTLKRWAYWVTLLVEVLVLIRGIFLFILPPSSFQVGAWWYLSLLFIFYLTMSSNVRAALFQQNGKHSSENEKSGISPHIFE